MTNPPLYYSDVSHDYERYANMWWYGLPPYLKHLFEYPPAAIPLLIIPLAIDLAGLGVYYFNYRLQIFVIETVVYFFILKVLKKTFSSLQPKYLAIIFYNLACLIAKDFWYEGLDLAFTGSLTLALASFLLTKRSGLKSKVLFWTLFWLSVAIKFVTFPLFFPFFFIKGQNLKKEAKSFLIGFLLIWGLPLLIFRSSLSVFLFFHAKRPLHASSFPAFIVYTLNHFTNSEKMIKLEWFGPLSQQMLFWSFIFLGINTALVLLWGIKRFFTNKKVDRYLLMLKLSLVYLITFILSGKIFSPPFNIWYVPLLTIFPYKNKKSQLLFFFLGTWSLILNTTNIVKLPETIMIYPFAWSYLRNLARFPPLILIVFLTLLSAKALSPNYHK